MFGRPIGHACTSIVRKNISISLFLATKSLVGSARQVHGRPDTLVLASAKPHSVVPNSRHASISNEAAPTPLPELPKAPPYPCPHLTEHEIAQYIEPLASYGWTLGVWDGIRDSKESPHHVPELMKCFEFSTPSEVMQFATEASDIWKREKHHPIMTINNHQVHIRVHTHSAQKDGTKCPGVTLRDIRLALLLETISVKL